MDTNDLRQTIGANFRAIRDHHKLTREQVVSHARRVGLAWTPSKLGDFESGRNRIYFDVLLAAVLALDNALGQGHGASRKRPRVTLSDLLASDSNVAVNADLRVRGEALVKVCQGKPWEVWGGLDADDDVAELLDDAPGALGERFRMRVTDVDDMRKRSTVTETRLAARLGVDPDTVLGLTWKLWKRPFREERDRRAGPNRGSRAQVARTLATELQAELWKEQHGDN
jgi:transcriptional regulator with XRE-family HTH domain